MVNEAGLWEGKGQAQALVCCSAGWGSGPTAAPGTAGDAGKMEPLAQLRVHSFSEKNHAGAMGWVRQSAVT